MSRVLVVDDSKDTADSMALILQLEGYQVAVAYDGKGALQAAQVQKPQAVLLDIGLPGMDGYRVARTLRSDPTHERTLLVAITGYGHEDDKRRSREAGFDFHLVKPVDPEQLCQLLAESSETCGPASGEVRRPAPSA
jgi:CheY-like chemotaxis protein